MEVVFEKGSLSELITGKKVDNKEKVVIRYGKVDEVQTPQNELSIGKEDTSHTLIKKPRKKKTPRENKSNTATEENGIQLVSSEKSIIDSVKKNTENEEPVPKHDKKGNRKEKKEKAKRFKELQEKKETLLSNPEELARTIFVGNVPLTATKIKFKKFFSKYGKVESVRFRCPPVKNINTSKKVAVIKGEYHPERDSWTSYVKFQTTDDAKKALEANGQIYKDHHLRVSICKSEEKRDENKAIFLGNLPLNIEDDQLWKTFECCGKIESVRIVRDSATGMGKGFAFVNFASTDSVQLALEMEDVKINKNTIRIQPCNTKAARKNKINNSSKVIKPRKPKKEENNKKRKRDDENDELVGKKIKKNKSLNSPNKRRNVNVSNTTNGFQQFSGTKVAIKKKKKKDRGLLKKQSLAKKLIPHSK